MKKYLKMSDVFNRGVLHDDGSTFIRDSCASGIAWFNYDAIDDKTQAAKYAAHAINSHDELVAMNKDLLEVIERVIGSSNEFDKIMGTSEWADGYKQCAIDTGEALRGMLDNIKAKGTA